MKTSKLVGLLISSILIAFTGNAHAEYYVVYGSPSYIETVSYSPYAVEQRTRYTCDSSYREVRYARSTCYATYHPVRHHYHPHHYKHRYHHCGRSYSCGSCNCQSYRNYQPAGYYYDESYSDFDLDRRTADDVGADLEIN